MPQSKKKAQKPATPTEPLVRKVINYDTELRKAIIAAMESFGSSNISAEQLNRVVLFAYNMGWRHAMQNILKAGVEALGGQAVDFDQYQMKVPDGEDAE